MVWDVGGDGGVCVCVYVGGGGGEGGGCDCLLQVLSYFLLMSYRCVSLWCLAM